MFDPSEFFVIAEDLYKNNTTPAGYRTVIGRAYYAAFLVARNRAGLISTGAGGHENVAKHYKSAPDAVHTLIGNRLDTLRAERASADYDCTADIGQRKAGKAIALSRDVIKDINGL